MKFKRVKSQTRKLLHGNIKGYNKNMTNDILRTYNWKALLANTHPLDRPDFAIILYKDGTITEKEMKVYQIK